VAKSPAFMTGGAPAAVEIAAGIILAAGARQSEET
jgi:hypothetical protein